MKEVRKCAEYNVDVSELDSVGLGLLDVGWSISNYITDFEIVSCLAFRESSADLLGTTAFGGHIADSGCKGRCLDRRDEIRDSQSRIEFLSSRDHERP